MKNILTLATNDLSLFLRDRLSLLWLIAMPLAFILAMGFAFRSGGQSPASNFQPPVTFTNEDEGFLSPIFRDELGQQGLWVVSGEQVDRAKHAIRVPADFTAQVLAKKQTRIEVSPLKGADDMTKQVVDFKVWRAVIAVNAYLVQHAVTHGAAVAPDEASMRAIVALPDAVTIDGKYAGKRPVPDGFNQSLPGTLVMYLLMNVLIFGGTRVAQERALGVLRRISLHPVRPYELVFGKILGLLLLSLVPTVVLLTIGQVFLGVDLLPQLHWILLALLLLSWVAASLGVLVGFAIKAEEKVVGLCLLVALPAAALGGCWWPMEIVPAWAQPVCYALPTAWTMDALHQFITFGGGIEHAAKALGIVALYGLVANVAAMKFFRV